MATIFMACNSISMVKLRALGAEVDNPRWKALWNGKKAAPMDNGESANHRFSKSAACGRTLNFYIDALAGCDTLTSVGVA